MINQQKKIPVEQILNILHYIKGSIYEKTNKTQLKNKQKGQNIASEIFCRLAK
jgi:hypothetical protein